MALFRTVGFVSDEGQLGFVTDRVVPPPTAPMTIYRGTTWGHRRKMAWTEDPEWAEWFANRWPSGGMVFKATVAPEAVLALINGTDSRREAEVVVDPRLLPPLGKSAIISGRS